MSETTGKNVVSLLEEHVDHVISTVKTLRDDKLQLEVEIARLNSDLIQRDARIQELETQNNELREASEEERTRIRKQLEELMDGLAEPDATSDDSDESPTNTEAEVKFTANN